MIVGLTGPIASGKGEVVRVLKSKGFKHITLSDIVRQEATNRGMEQTRENLMAVGNSMRGQHGPGVMAKKALEIIIASNHPNWVIDGIRNPAEIDEIHKSQNARVIGINAERKTLMRRIRSRGRMGDPIDEAEIHKVLDKDWGMGQPVDGQQVGECLKKVDKIIKNESTLDELDENVLKELGLE